jgi:hypothetical protein
MSYFVKISGAGASLVAPIVAASILAGAPRTPAPGPMRRDPPLCAPAPEAMEPAESEAGATPTARPQALYASDAPASKGRLAPTNG